MKKKSLMALLACTLGLIGACFLNDGTSVKAATIEDKSTSLTDTMNSVTTDSAVKVGDVLANPEEGWKRSDDRDEHIRYCEGSDKTEAYTPSGETSTVTFVSDTSKSDHQITFSFTGSRLRLIGLAMDGNFDGDFNEAEISYDGGKTFEKIELINADKKESCGIEDLLYEKTGLSDEKHDVILRVLTDTNGFELNAIDIDENGGLGSFIQ